MAKALVHLPGDGSVRLEWLADPAKAIGSLLPVVDSADVPDQQEFLVWNGTRLTVDQSKKDAAANKDKRPPFEKLLDQLQADGVLSKAKADLIRG